MARSALSAVLIVTALGISACASSSPAAAPSGSPSVSPSGSAAAFPVTAGGVTLDSQPQKIISMSPTATDMLFSIGAGPQVIEVDKNSDYFGANPPAQKPPADIDAFNPSAEKIAAENPDLVVISDDENKIVEQLTALKIPVYVAPAAVTLDDTYSQLTTLGELSGHAPQATIVVQNEKTQIDAALAGLPSRATPLTYYYELDPTFYSVTSKTFIGSLFAMAHLTNIADPSDASGKAGGYPQLSAEVIIKANPDLIFLADAGCCKQSASTVAARPGWSTLSAVQNHHVVDNISDDVASQWGTRVPELLNDIVTAAKLVPAS